MLTTETMAIAPLECVSCGAPVPLADGDVAVCRHCAARVPIPEAHQELRRKVEGARARRREIEQLLRRRTVVASPKLRRVYAWTVIPAAVIGVPVAFGFTQSEMNWFAREWVVLAGILPFMVTLLPWLVLWALGSPEAYLQALGLRLRPAPPPPGTRGFDCGVCGAPLEIEPNAYAATCDYCGSDSWVRDAPLSWGLDREVRRESANLADVYRAREFQSFDIRLLLVVYTIVTALACALLWLFLPGRATWTALRYTRSVGGEWMLVGRPGPVMDLAALGETIVAVGKDGRVMQRREREWKTVSDTGSYLGVGADDTRALVVGKHGKAAWLEGDDLKPADVGLDVDLFDAWVSGSSAIVVGAEGRSAAFENGQWKPLERANENDLVGVWGDGHGRAWAVGGVEVFERKDDAWSGQFLDGLPRPVAIAGAGDDVYVAALPMDENERGATLLRLDAGQWQAIARGHRDVTAVAAGANELWGVGPRGYVFKWLGRPPEQRAPCEGDLRAAAMVGGSLVVGGDDGVFRHPKSAGR
jgi:hypothetical protein